MKIWARALLVVAMGGTTCACSEANEPAVDEADLTKGRALSCTEDRARFTPPERNRFASIAIAFRGDEVTITKMIYSDRLWSALYAQLAFAWQRLAKGVDYDGSTPLTQAQRDATAERIAKLDALVEAGLAGTLSLHGKVKPYVREPARPTIQYPLEVATTGIDDDLLWELLGNEGHGARLLLPAAMEGGKRGSPDIELEGSQGPGWDRFDCR